jgi:hypothetical protein
VVQSWLATQPSSPEWLHPTKNAARQRLCDLTPKPKNSQPYRSNNKPATATAAEQQQQQQQQQQQLQKQQHCQLQQQQAGQQEKQIKNQTPPAGIEPATSR